MNKMLDIGNVAPRCLVSGLKSAVLLLCPWQQAGARARPSMRLTHLLAAGPSYADIYRSLDRNKTGRLDDSVLRTFSQYTGRYHGWHRLSPVQSEIRLILCIFIVDIYLFK